LFNTSFGKLGCLILGFGGCLKKCFGLAVVVTWLTWWNVGESLDAFRQGVHGFDDGIR